MQACSRSHTFSLKSTFSIVLGTHYTFANLGFASSVLSILFFSFLLCFFPLLPYVALVVLLCIIVLFIRCAYKYVPHGYVPGVVSLQVIRNGITQLVMVPLPSRPGTARHVFFCIISSVETFAALLL